MSGKCWCGEFAGWHVDENAFLGLIDMRYLLRGVFGDAA
jgi:hypothetical protein